MKLLILLICLPALVFAQEPVKPAVSSVNYQSADFSTIAKLGADVAPQSKAIATVIKAARTKLQVLKNEQAKLSAALAEKKKSRSGLEPGSTAASQLDKQIKDIETNIAELNNKITSQQQFINRQQEEITKLKESIDRLAAKIDELKAKEEKNEASKAKNEAAPSYAKLKLLLDSLPATEKAKLTATEIKTLSFYNNLHEKDMVFKTATLAARLDVQKEELEVMAEDKKETFQSSQDAVKAIMEMIRKYLETLAAMQSKVAATM